MRDSLPFYAVYGEPEGITHCIETRTLSCYFWDPEVRKIELIDTIDKIDRYTGKRESTETIRVLHALHLADEVRVSLEKWTRSAH